ncbi:MAG: hypothetical protein JOZ41_16280 [Chloroflexi bacterium]|nr:hypothetical protein [Chloroflexota bacterium]
MAASAFTLQEGMSVFGSDGEEIGKVSHILRQVPGALESGAERRTGVGLGDTGETVGGFSPPEGTATWVRGESGLIVVAHGGFLGVGAQHLYVPFDAVADVAPGDRAILTCTREECGRRYGRKPAGV